MTSVRRCRAVGVLALVLGGVACGRADDQTVPTADELASELLAAGDLEGDWTVHQRSDDVDSPVAGVVPDDLQQSLPDFELCDAASDASVIAADQLRWLAFEQLDLGVDDPIEPPDDRTGHMVFLQEFMTSDDPDAMTATFEAVRDGLTACVGDLEAGEEGPGTLAVAPAPEVGEDRAAFLTTIAEAGGWAEWRIHQVLVLDGARLMLVSITDIRAGEGTEPYFAADDLDHIVEVAAGRW